MLLVEMLIGTTFMEETLLLLNRTTHAFTFQPTNPTSKDLPWRYTFNHMKIYIHKVIHWINAWITKYCKQPEYPYTREWLNQLPSTHIMDYYTAIKKNKEDLFELVWSPGHRVKVKKIKQTRITIVCCILCRKERI